MKLKESEADIQKSILDYLMFQEKMNKLFYTRINTVGIFNPTRNIYYKPSHHSKNGMSDILVVKNGIPYFIEVKSKIGKIGEEQTHFSNTLLSAGKCSNYYVVRSLDDIIKIVG